jgi:Rieske Fe-S protein
VNGWYRERARETVFLVWDGHDSVRAMSATCTHLGCQVQWDGEGKKFKCPCHGGVYSHDGSVVSGPPPRPLDVVEAKINPDDASVLVRL